MTGKNWTCFNPLFCGNYVLIKRLFYLLVAYELLSASAEAADAMF
jgi:hypothetical protein